MHNEIKKYDVLDENQMHEVPVRKLLFSMFQKIAKINFQKKKKEKKKIWELLLIFASTDTKTLVFCSKPRYYKTPE